MEKTVFFSYKLYKKRNNIRGTFFMNKVSPRKPLHKRNGSPDYSPNYNAIFPHITTSIFINLIKFNQKRSKIY